MKESQKTISDWATATFGQASSDLRVATRALEELVEALRGFTAGKPREEIVVELADTKIVLYRLAERRGFQLDDQVRLDHFTHPGDGFELLCLAGRHLLEGMMRFDHDPDRYGLVFQQQIVWCVRCMEAVALTWCFDIDEIVDEKMVINRHRKWNQTGDGHGYHVREKAVAA